MDAAAYPVASTCTLVGSVPLDFDGLNGLVPRVAVEFRGLGYGLVLERAPCLRDDALGEREDLGRARSALALQLADRVSQQDVQAHEELAHALAELAQGVALAVDLLGDRLVARMRIPGGLGLLAESWCPSSAASVRSSSSLAALSRSSRSPSACRPLIPRRLAFESSLSVTVCDSPS